MDLVPSDAASQSALALATAKLPTPILNHSLRVYLLARWLGEHNAAAEWPGWKPDPTLLFLACIFHDLGTCPDVSGPEHFEVEGGFLAKQHCLQHGIAETAAHDVWTAIAVHTSAGIAEHIHPLACLVRLGVRCDFAPNADAVMPGAGAYAATIEKELPRLEVEMCLADAVVAQGCAAPTQKHPKASWPGMLMRAHLENPSHDGWVDGRNPEF